MEYVLIALACVSYPQVGGNHLILPLENVSAIDAGFYQRRRGQGKKRRIHGAIDQNTPIGTPVRAVGDGIVTKIYEMSSYMSATNRILKRLRRGQANSWSIAKKRFKQCRCTRRIRRISQAPWRSGIYLSIQHKTDKGRVFKTQYMHLNKIVVRLGANVTRGQVVAYSGDTAIIDNPPHLHFQIRCGERKRNPQKYIKALDRN